MRLREPQLPSKNSTLFRILDTEALEVSEIRNTKHIIEILEKNEFRTSNFALQILFQFH